MSEGGSTGVGKGGKLQGRYPEEGIASIQYIHKPSDNASLAIDTLLLQMNNGEQVYIINSVYCCLSGGSVHNREPERSQPGNHLVSYLRVHPYICSALTPVLEGSGWESPPIATERYERRPCFCRVRCTCRSSDLFYYLSKTDSWWEHVR